METQEAKPVLGFEEGWGRLLHFRVGRKQCLYCGYLLLDMQNNYVKTARASSSLAVSYKILWCDFTFNNCSVGFVHHYVAFCSKVFKQRLLFILRHGPHIKAVSDQVVGLAIAMAGARGRVCRSLRIDVHGGTKQQGLQ